MEVVLSLFSFFWETTWTVIIVVLSKRWNFQEENGLIMRRLYVDRTSSRPAIITEIEKLQDIFLIKTE